MIVTNKMLANYYGVSPKTATKIRREILAYWGLPPSHRLLRCHVAKYEHLNLSDLEI